MMIANGNTTFIITFCMPYFYIDIFSCFISLNSTWSIFRFQFIRSFTRLCCDCICICHCQRVYDRACLSASYSVLDSKRVMEFQSEKFVQKNYLAKNLLVFARIMSRKIEIHKLDWNEAKKFGKKTKIKWKKRLEQSNYHNFESLKKLISNRKEWNFWETRMKRIFFLLTDLNI